VSVPITHNGGVSSLPVGRCINTVAQRFTIMPECSLLPADCFSCILRTAREMGVPIDLLEAGAQRFLDDRLPSSDAQEPVAPCVTPEEFQEVCSVQHMTHTVMPMWT